MVQLKAEQNNQKPTALVIRESLFLFVTRIITIVSLLVIVRLLIRFPNMYMLQHFSNFSTQINDISILGIVILAVIELFLVIYVTVMWSNEYFEVMSGEIIHYSGFLSVKKQIYACEHIQSVELDQGVIGRIFNFGTLTLYSPSLEEKILLYNIDNPIESMRVLEDILNINPIQNNGTSRIFFRT